MAFQQFNISPVLTPVRVASIANIAGTYFNGQTNNGVGATLTIAASSLTIDSVVVNVGDRVLLQVQTNTNEQGIYVVNSIGATVVLQRAADQQSIEQIHAGQYAPVAAGALRAGNIYSIVEPLPAILGIDALVINADPSSGAVAFSGGASTANALPVFSDTAGNIKAATTTVTLAQPLVVANSIQSTTGDITSGSSGDAGSFVSFPATAANGTLILAAANAGGAFNTTISNAASVGQSQVISIPDVGAATGKFIVNTAALVSGNYLVNSGTGGVVVDSGVPAQKFAQVSMTAAQWNGMYAAPFLLVAAPGANLMIIVDSIQLQMTYVSANYAAGGVVSAQYDLTANGAGVHASSDEAAADFFAAASTVFKLNGGLVLAPFTTCANKGLYLSNLTQAFTTGDSTWRIKVYYHLISTTA